MKIQIAYEVPAAAVQRVEALVSASTLRDIELTDVPVSIERGEYTCIVDDDSAEAVQVLREVEAEIDGRRVAPSARHGMTIFGCAYDL